MPGMMLLEYAVMELKRQQDNNNGGGGGAPPSQTMAR